MALTCPGSMFLLPSRALGAILLFLLLPSPARCDALDVTWVSPTAGDMYGPGAYILGEWEADTEVESPSFQLCEAGAGDAGDGSEDACGTAVQPTVSQDPDTGSYEITLYVLFSPWPSVFR